jgi:ArsR family transcriptional regulator, arsenate/arsenite/antimonite-responsive transcriptional repressor / arsenate reductase (thioredoxin)
VRTPAHPGRAPQPGVLHWRGNDPPDPGRGRAQARTPAAAIDPGAIAAAGRHRLPLPRLRPRHIGDVRHHGDLVVTVCDLAHEELAEATAVHWSIPDPVPAGDPGSFDVVLAQLADRVRRFAPRLAAVS